MIVEYMAHVVETPQHYWWCSVIYYAGGKGLGEMEFLD